MVAHELRQFIASDACHIGHTLPTTRELAARFNVSSKTIHDALGLLEAENLIERQPRVGTIITARTPAKHGRSIVMFAPSAHLAVEGAPSWLGQILLGVDIALLDKGYQPTRLPHAPVPDGQVEQWARDVIGNLHHEVAGAVLPGGYPGAGMLAQALDQRRIPWVSIKSITATTHHNFVSINLWRAGYTIGHLLGRASITDVLQLNCARPGHHSHLQLFAGLQHGYLEADGTYETLKMVHCAERDEQSGHDVIAAHLQDHKSPQVVVTTGDYLAMGAIRAFREHGLRVPEDVGVIGGTDFPTPTYADPPLTAIHQPMQMAGKQVAELLLTAIHNRSQQFTGVELLPQIVIRNSMVFSDNVLESLQAADLDELVPIHRGAPVDESPQSETGG